MVHQATQFTVAWFWTRWPHHTHTHPCTHTYTAHRGTVTWRVVPDILVNPWLYAWPCKLRWKASSTLFWWCKVSLHLVSLSHTRRNEAPTFGWEGVMFFHSVLPFTWGQGKEETASSKEAVSWRGGVSGRGGLETSNLEISRSSFSTELQGRSTLFPPDATLTQHTPSSVTPSEKFP